VMGRKPEEHLAGEIYRIQRALIASFVHPNTQGARRYADMAIMRYELHRDTLDSLPPLPPLPPMPGGPESLEDLLVRCKLRGNGNIRGDIGHQFIDAVRVTVRTSSKSDKNFPADLNLHLILKKDGRGNERDEAVLQLNMQYFEISALGTTVVTKFHPEFEPLQTSEFSVDVSGYHKRGRVLLKNLVGAQLVVSDWPQGKPTWIPEDVRLDINGVEVLHRRLRGVAMHPRDRLDLEYPAPFQGKPPVLKPTILRQGEIPMG
jgi:hypothetical protein